MDNKIIPQYTNSNNIQKYLSRLTTVLVSFLAIGSFALSYSALKQVAIDNGIQANLAWLWPLLVDFALIVFSLSVVSAYLKSEKTKKQWTLVIIYTVATIGFNIAHAPNSLLSQVVASVAPISLFFSFELLMSQLKTDFSRLGTIASLEKLTQTVNELTAKITQLKNQITTGQDKIKNLDSQLIEKQKALSEVETKLIEGQKTLSELTVKIDRQKDNNGKLKLTPTSQKSTAKKSAKIAERQEQVLTLLKQNLTIPQIAQKLRVSEGTIKNDKKALNGKIIMGVYNA